MYPKLIKNIKKIVKYLMGIDLYPYQIRIIDKILNDTKRITIRATTRAGKSFCVAIGAILYATFYDNKRIGILAPSNEKTKPVMDYITKILSSNAIFEGVVDIDTMGLSKLERLKKEVSKRRITFKNGSSIEVRSVDVNRKGFGVTGFGYDLSIVDESAEIPDSSFSMIYRMLLEHKDAKILEIYNPWNLNHTFKHANSSDWESIKIDWRECVECGRMTLEQVKDQREELTDIEFKVLVEAEFPEDMDKAIFTEDILKRADVRKDLPKEYDKVQLGVDVARGGNDLSVITIVGIKDGIHYIIDYKEYDLRDLMVLVGYVKQIADTYNKPFIVVDTVGLGAGVKDRLLEDHYNVFEFIAGSKAKRSDRFYNLKTEALFQLRDLMKAEKVYNLPSKHRFELKKYTFEPKGDKTIKSVDPEDKSPDFSDSLVLACYEPPKTIIGKLDW